MFGFFGSRSDASQTRVYLDYAAATPLREAVAAAMQPYLVENFGNAGAIHQEGVQAQNAVADARLTIARTLGVRPDDIVFTASGTEANNLALLGRFEYVARHDGRAYTDMELITTRIEHPSVLEVADELARRGVTVRYVDVDEAGLVDQKHLRTLLNEKTVLVSVAYVNSEIGTVQDVKKITRSVRAYNREHEAGIVVHCDAAQAPLWCDCNIPALGVDVCAFDAAKCGGPKGVGVLVVRNTSLHPVLYGGGQERGLRSGTENTAGIVGAAVALKLAQDEHKTVAERVADSRDALLAELTTALSEMVVNGPERAARVANNINISLPGFDTEYAVVWLDSKGIACSTKSACGSGRGEGSLVVQATSGDAAAASSTIRFTLGLEGLSAAERARVVEALQEFLVLQRSVQE